MKGRFKNWRRPMNNMEYGKFVAGSKFRERIMLVLFGVIGCHDVPSVNGSSG